jgi:hypothetical protein
MRKIEEEKKDIKNDKKAFNFHRSQPLLYNT